MILNDIPKKNKQVLSKYLDGETFLLELDEGKFFKLDKVGTDTWKLINGKRSISEIINSLQDIYEVEKTKLRKDIEDFIERGIKTNVIDIKKNT